MRLVGINLILVLDACYDTFMDCNIRIQEHRWDYQVIIRNVRPLSISGYTCGVTASLPPKPPNAEMSITFRRQNVHVMFRCASLTPGTSDNHCPVSTCKINNQWSDYNMSCTTEDCYRNSSTYRGKLSCTVSGRTCQYWNTDTPHIKNYQVSDPNDKSTNYCRDPSHDGVPWCYTIDKDVRWEPCPVPKC